ncbi:MAG: phosphatidylglycerophosphatase A [Sulfuricellaceae bacterium]
MSPSPAGGGGTGRGRQSAASPDWRFLFRHPAHFFALGLGSGLAPKAPGTAGSAVAIPLYLALAYFLPQPWLLAVVAASFLVGIWFCDVTGKALGEADFGGIVWDEIVAVWLVLVFTPMTVWWYGAAFALFRLFDIWKPFPIGYFDRHTHGGFGVMLDDLLAAAYTIGIIRFALLLI